jgi:hypothetical protein
MKARPRRSSQRANGTEGLRLRRRPERPAADPWPELGFRVGAGEGNRTLMTSLEGWGSTIELRPRGALAPAG